MNKDQFIEIGNSQDSLNTSESFSRDFYVIKNSLIMPFINLEIEPDITEMGSIVRCEFSYIILNEVFEIYWEGINKSKIKIENKIQLSEKKSKKSQWFAFNGEFEFYELLIQYSSMEIFIPHNSRISTEWFTPIETPNFKKNISNEKSKYFYQLDMLKNKFDNWKSYKKPLHLDSIEKTK